MSVYFCSWHPHVSLVYLGISIASSATAPGRLEVNKSPDSWYPQLVDDPTDFTESWVYIYMGIFMIYEYSMGMCNPHDASFIVSVSLLICVGL